jgi:hypothetical protein
LSGSDKIEMCDLLMCDLLTVLLPV